MKQNELHRLPLIENVEYSNPKDWTKKARSVIQQLRQVHSKAMKTNSKITIGMLDLDPAMEKRRIAALISSLKNQSEIEQKYANDWITLNIFCESYASLQFGGHILTAASIWLLDRFTELNVQFDEVYKLLPKNEEMLDPLRRTEIWDSQYSETLIASIEYVLYYRNQDISPLESNGCDGHRIFTSNLAAEGKDHADVQSRNNFEMLLAFLPLEIRADVVKHFEDCFLSWTNRFFIGISYLHDRYQEKCDAINTIRKEVNRIQDELKKIAREVRFEEEKINKNSKLQVKSKSNYVNAFLVNPRSSITEIPTLVNQGKNSSVANSQARRITEPTLKINDLIVHLQELEVMHDKSMVELEEIIEKREKFINTMMHRGYLSPNIVKECFPLGLRDALLKPLPIYNPYELCFALLYSIEIGSDIPWLYGSCIGMMSEIIDNLPWGLSDYSEEEKPFVEKNLLLSENMPIFPNWYCRNYTLKDEEDYEVKNLAQIIYEATGCIVPRNLYRQDVELDKLRGYGLSQNIEISMLHCMFLLRNFRKQKRALNLEPEYINGITSSENQAEDVKHTSEEWVILEKQIQLLRSALHSAEKATEEANKKLAKQIIISEAEHRELADLREVLFNKEEFENYESNVIEAVHDNRYPYEVERSTVVFGGHERWVKCLKPMLKGNIKFIAKEMKIDTLLVRYADVIWIQTNAISHRAYYSIVNITRKLGKPIRYFTNASAIKCAEQIIENDNRDV